MIHIQLCAWTGQYCFFKLRRYRVEQQRSGLDSIQLDCYGIWTPQETKQALERVQVFTGCCWAFAHCLTSSSLFLFCGQPSRNQPSWKSYCLKYEKLFLKKKSIVMYVVQIPSSTDCICIWRVPGRLCNYTHFSTFKGLWKIPCTVSKAYVRGRSYSDRL